MATDCDDHRIQGVDRGERRGRNIQFRIRAGGSGRWASAEGSAAWKPFTSGAAGTITLAEEHAVVEAHMSGLAPETTYYVRIKMHNVKGEAVQTTYAATEGAGGEVSSFTTGAARPIVAASKRA